MWGRSHTCVCQRVNCCNMPGDKMRTQFGSYSFFPFPVFFSQWFHLTLIWRTRFFHLLRLSCTVSWKADGSFANISLACCSLLLLKWIQLYCFIERTEFDTDLLIVELNWGIPSSKGVVARGLICKWPIGFCIHHHSFRFDEWLWSLWWLGSRKWSSFFIVTNMIATWRTWSKFN